MQEIAIRAWAKVSLYSLFGRWDAAGVVRYCLFIFGTFHFDHSFGLRSSENKNPFVRRLAAHNLINPNRIFLLCRLYS